MCPSPSGPRARCWRGRRPLSWGRWSWATPSPPPTRRCRSASATPSRGRSCSPSPGATTSRPARCWLPTTSPTAPPASTRRADSLCRGGSPLRRLWRHLSQRGSHWQAGPLPTEHLRPDMAQKGGRCYRGQACKLSVQSLTFAGNRVY